MPVNSWKTDNWDGNTRRTLGSFAGSISAHNPGIALHSFGLVAVVAVLAAAE